MKKLCAVACVVLVAGCSRDIDLSKLENKQPEEILKYGKSEAGKKNYGDAVQIYDELQRLYPYSRLTADAQIEAGDCNYKAKKYEEAISSFEIFVKTHPMHKSVPYALFMLGVIHFEQMPIIERDQDHTVMALSYLLELRSKYSDSEYAKKAYDMIIKLRQQMAGREVYVARYYQKRHNYAAAIVRLNVVISSYSETEHVPEAMHRLVECYVSMGFLNEAQLVNGILQQACADTKWANYSKQLISSKMNK
jgi:outer membrane protein assembly factor BamD